jgi:hypothetical protein
MSAAALFKEQALFVVNAEIERLRAELTFDQARALPEADGKDIVVAGKEVQLTVFRQSDVGFLKGDVLVTVQIARFGLGGVVTYRTERGLVFSPATAPRDATQTELQNSGG